MVELGYISVPSKHNVQSSRALIPTFIHHPFSHPHPFIVNPIHDVKTHTSPPSLSLQTIPHSSPHPPQYIHKPPSLSQNPSHPHTTALFTRNPTSPSTNQHTLRSQPTHSSQRHHALRALPPALPQPAPPLQGPPPQIHYLRPRRSAGLPLLRVARLARLLVVSPADGGHGEELGDDCDGRG